MYIAVSIATPFVSFAQNDVPQARMGGGERGQEVSQQRMIQGGPVGDRVQKMMAGATTSSMPRIPGPKEIFPTGTEVRFPVAREMYASGTPFREEMKGNPMMKDLGHEEFLKQIQDKQQGAAKEKGDRDLKFKQELGKLKDANREARVVEVNNKLDGLNSNAMNRFVQALDQLAKVLSNIIQRTDNAASKGVDVTSARTAIATASSSIASARTVVVAQSAKIYSPTITSSSTLRADITSTKEGMKTDLKKVEDSVKSARDSVQAAATTLAQLSRSPVTPAPTVTSTATSTQ